MVIPPPLMANPSNFSFDFSLKLLTINAVVCITIIAAAEPDKNRPSDSQAKPRFQKHMPTPMTARNNELRINKRIPVI